jgi:predicted ATPase
MGEICEICMIQLKLWDDYVTIDYEAEAILCIKCQEEVDELYDKHEGKKEFEKCVEEIRKRRQKQK